MTIEDVVPSYSNASAYWVKPTLDRCIVLVMLLLMRMVELTTLVLAYETVTLKEHLAVSPLVSVAVYVTVCGESATVKTEPGETEALS